MCLYRKSRESWEWFRAVLFDMDGVIINTMPRHFQAWQQVFESIGITVDKLEIYQREGETGISHPF